MSIEPNVADKWVVQFDADQLEFSNFGAAVAYADSLALTRSLVKLIDPVQHLIQLAEQRTRIDGDLHNHVNSRMDS